MQAIINDPRRKEKLLDITGQYISEVKNALCSLKKLIHEYLDDKSSDALDFLLSSVRNHESKCDSLRREIERQSLSSAYLRPHSDIIFMLIEAFDKVPNKAESVANFISLANPDIPPAYHEDIKQILRMTVKCVNALASSVIILFSNYQLAANETKSVEIMESAVDKMEWHLMRRIFASDAGLAEKLLLRELVQDLCAIADRAEDASDVVEILAMKFLQ